MDEQYYYPYNITVWDKDIVVSEIVGIAFDEISIEEQDVDYGEIASYFSIKVGKVMDKLVNSKLYSKKIDPDYWHIPTHSSYISQIYINTDYSECGIAEYIFTNLFYILRYNFNIHMRCFVLQPYQCKKDESGTWDRDSNKYMDDVIRSALVNSSYIELGKTGLYAINCMCKKGESYE